MTEVLTPAQPLAVGANFPQFKLESNQAGKFISNESFAGKPYLVYFYPKASTPGCTAQACSLAESHTIQNIAVVGVSPDSVKLQQNFAEKYNLDFPLLDDTELTLAKACGVYGAKTSFGKTAMRVHRIAFLVGADGKVLHTFLKVTTNKFAQEVAEVLEQLKIKVENPVINYVA